MAAGAARAQPVKLGSVAEETTMCCQPKNYRLFTLEGEVVASAATSSTGGRCLRDGITSGSRGKKTHAI